MAPDASRRTRMRSHQIAPATAQGGRGGWRRKTRASVLTTRTLRTDPHGVASSCICIAATGERKQVRPEGFEPPTLGSEDRCSIQLSYGRFYPCFYVVY